MLTPTSKVKISGAGENDVGRLLRTHLDGLCVQRRVCAACQVVKALRGEVQLANQAGDVRLHRSVTNELLRASAINCNGSWQAPLCATVMDNQILNPLTLSLHF